MKSSNYLIYQYRLQEKSLRSELIIPPNSVREHFINFRFLAHQYRRHSKSEAGIAAIEYIDLILRNGDDKFSLDNSSLRAIYRKRHHAIEGTAIVKLCHEVLGDKSISEHCRPKGEDLEDFMNIWERTVCDDFALKISNLSVREIAKYDALFLRNIVLIENRRKA